MNTLRFVPLLCLTVVLVGCKGKSSHDASVGEASTEVVTLSLGLEESVVAESLVKFGARDVSAGIQAIAGAPTKNWMWRVESPELSIETLYQDGVLNLLNIWDWKNRKQNSYHASLEHYQVDRLVLPNDGTYQSNILKTINPGKR